MNNKQLTLTIGWLYPELMSTYGDRGNIIVLTRRLEARGIFPTIRKISLENKKEDIESCDLLFMGGAQDTQQEIVNEDLFKNKGSLIQKAIENGKPGLFICGAYQFLGQYYKTAEGIKLPGLSIFDIYTENPGTKRLIGNLIVRSLIHELSNKTYVGFENHGGRTYLGKGVKPFAYVLHGYGNNGNDNTEGMVYKHAIGTYMHGPILPKNPELADYLLAKALSLKYKKEITLESLPLLYEDKARAAIASRFNKKL